MFYCDPFGMSGTEHLFNYGNDQHQHNYIFFHDQEPIHLDIHSELFLEVEDRNLDLNNKHGPTYTAIVTSECNSEAVEQVCSTFKWRPYYYFFHGWAALDWYRGYHRTFLIAAPEKRTITKSFISPNRIIGGRRQHRVDLMYHLLQRGINNAWIGFPDICPVENVHVRDLAGPNRAPVFEAAKLPWHFPGETDHPMHSCWLSLFNESAESLAYLVTETVATGRRHHLTEKTFKPICLGMPFVLVSTAGSLKYLRSYGFKTFDSIWDESYDLEMDDDRRLIKIADLLKYLDTLSVFEKQNLFNQALPIIQHNYDHFYNGKFESILWKELTEMLNTISEDFKV